MCGLYQSGKAKKTSPANYCNKGLPRFGAAGKGVKPYYARQAAQSGWIRPPRCKGIRPGATGGLQGQGSLRIMAATGPQIMQVFKRDNPVETEELRGLMGKNGSDVHLSSPIRLICQLTTAPHENCSPAWVAERVDARDLKSLGRKAVPVRVRPQAPVLSISYMIKPATPEGLKMTRCP